MSLFVKKLAAELAGKSQVSCFQRGVRFCKTFIHRFDSDPRLQAFSSLSRLFSSRNSAQLPVFQHDLRAAHPARKIALKGEAQAKLRPEPGRGSGRRIAKSWTAALPLFLTGCSSDRTASMTAYELLAGVCVFLIAFLAYVLHQYGTAHREMMRLRSEARRVVDLASLTPEQLDEMAEAQQCEIDRVSRKALSGVSL